MSETIKSHSDSKRAYYANGGSAIERPITARPRPKEFVAIEEKKEALDILLARPVSRNELIMTNYELDMYVGKWNLKQIEINNIDQINLFSIENWKTQKF